MSDPIIYTAKAQITALAVFLFILIGMIAAVAFSVDPPEARLTIGASIGIFAVMVLIGILSLRGKSIVLTDNGIDYHSTALIIDRDRKTKVDHIRLRWADIEYISAKLRGREFILTCHLFDSRTVELKPNNINPKATSTIFDLHHAHHPRPLR